MFYHFKNPPQFCVFSFLYDRPYTLSKGSHFTATEMHYFQKRSLVSTDLFMSHSSHFVRKESGVVRSNKWMLKGEKVVRSQQEMYMYFFFQSSVLAPSFPTVVRLRTTSPGICSEQPRSACEAAERLQTAEGQGRLGGIRSGAVLVIETLLRSFWKRK